MLPSSKSLRVSGVFVVGAIYSIALCAGGYYNPKNYGQIGGNLQPAGSRHTYEFVKPLRVINQHLSNNKKNYIAADGRTGRYLDSDEDQHYSNNYAQHEKNTNEEYYGNAYYGPHPEEYYGLHPEYFVYEDYPPKKYTIPKIEHNQLAPVQTPIEKVKSLLSEGLDRVWNTLRGNPFIGDLIDRQLSPPPPLAMLVLGSTAVATGGIAVQTGVVQALIDAINDLINPTTTTTAAPKVEDTIQSYTDQMQSNDQLSGGREARATDTKSNLKTKYNGLITSAFQKSGLNVQSVTINDITSVTNPVGILVHFTVTFKVKATESASIATTAKEFLKKEIEKGSTGVFNAVTISKLGSASITATTDDMQTTLDDASWGYGLDNGPAVWATILDGKYSNYCSQTTRQSPIDLKDPTTDGFCCFGTGSSTALTVKQEMTKGAFFNNGHTLEFKITPSDSFTATGGPFGTEVYKWFMLHFHWGSANDKGSEHIIAGTQYPLEMHMVHINSKYVNSDGTLDAAMYSTMGDGVGVLGFLFEIGDTDYTPLDPVINGIGSLTNRVGGAEEKEIELNLKDFYDSVKAGGFFSYEGSLTTPACNEVVTWVNFKNRIKISQTQIAAFRTLLDQSGKSLNNNFRPIQDLKARTLYFKS